MIAQMMSLYVLLSPEPSRFARDRCCFGTSNIPSSEPLAIVSGISLSFSMSYNLQVQLTIEGRTMQRINIHRSKAEDYKITHPPSHLPRSASSTHTLTRAMTQSTSQGNQLGAPERARSASRPNIGREYHLNRRRQAATR